MYLCIRCGDGGGGSYGGGDGGDGDGYDALEPTQESTQEPLNRLHVLNLVLALSSSEDMVVQRIDPMRSSAIPTCLCCTISWWAGATN
eukprot:SAG11_NODE_5583_length_1517_cov_2.405501_2_plen_88_part_00